MMDTGFMSHVLEATSQLLPSKQRCRCASDSLTNLGPVGTLAPEGPVTGAGSVSLHLPAMLPLLKEPPDSPGHQPALLDPSP